MPGFNLTYPVRGLPDALLPPSGAAAVHRGRRRRRSGRQSRRHSRSGSSPKSRSRSRSKSKSKSPKPIPIQFHSMVKPALQYASLHQIPKPLRRHAFTISTTTAAANANANGGGAKNSPRRSLHKPHIIIPRVFVVESNSPGPHSPVVSRRMSPHHLAAPPNIGPSRFTPPVSPLSPTGGARNRNGIGNGNGQQQQRRRVPARGPAPSSSAQTGAFSMPRFQGGSASFVRQRGFRYY